MARKKRTTNATPDGGNPSSKRMSSKIKKRLFLEALEKNYGVISPSLKNSGLKRSTYWSWMQKDEDFIKEVNNIKEMSLDFVETQIYKNIEKGKEASLIFYLKTKGRERGWVEKQEIDQNISYNQPLQLNIIPPSEHNNRTTIDITPENKKIENGNNKNGKT